MVKLQNNYNWDVEAMLFTVLLIGYFVAYLLPMLFTACDNVQMASVFYPDEGRYVQVIRGGLEAQTLRIHFVSYGHFFFNLVLIPLLFLQQFFIITDVHILLALRVISWIFGLGSVGLTFMIARRFFGRWTAWLSACLMMFIPLTLLEYSTIAHPDTLQLFFILASLYFTCMLAEEFNTKYLLWASGMAGLAFSAKYAGILLLPLIAFVFGLQLYRAESLEEPPKIEKRVSQMLGFFIVTFLFSGILLQQSVVTFLFSTDGHIESDWIGDTIELVRIGLFLITLLFVILYYLNWRKLSNSKQNKFQFGFYYSTISLMVFGLAFVVSSPNSLLELQFIQGLLYEGHNTRTGGFFTANSWQIAEQWFDILTSKYLLGFGLFVLGLAASFWNLWSRKPKMVKT
ncbi:MAG: glycosyltransferase family 39 protein [Chitinophagales bacterium]